MKRYFLTLVLAGLYMLSFSQTNEFKFNLAIHTDTVCPGEEVLLTASIMSGTPPYQFKDDENNIVSPPFKLYLDSSKIITISGKDALGSTWTSNVKVNIFKKPKIEIKSDILSGCQPLEVNFNEEASNSANRKYFWSYSDGGISFDKNPKYIFEDYGVFNVSLEVREKHGNKVCKNKKIAVFTIDVFEKPESRFIVDEDVQNNITPTFYFDNKSDITCNSYWSFGDNDSSIIYDPSHKYDSIGNYKVSLITESAEGCKDTSIKYVTVQPVQTFFKANAFTPDNDGINDVFIFKASEIDLDEFHFKVYDRWGHIIFETHDINEGWTGSVYGGKTAKPGLYVYVVTYKDFKNVEFTESGTVTLIR